MQKWYNYYKYVIVISNIIIAKVKCNCLKKWYFNDKIKMRLLITILLICKFSILFNFLYP